MATIDFAERVDTEGDELARKVVRADGLPIGHVVYHQRPDARIGVDHGWRPATDQDGPLLPLEHAVRLVADAARNERPSQDPHGRPILTVAQLRELLDGLPDETHVVLDDGAGWFTNIATTAVPLRGDDGAMDGGDYQCVTFFAGIPFDSRQF